MSIKKYIALTVGLFLSIPLSAAARIPSPGDATSTMPNHPKLVEAYQAVCDHLQNVPGLVSIVLGYCHPKKFTITKKLLNHASHSDVLNQELDPSSTAFNSKIFNGLLAPEGGSSNIILYVAAGKNNNFNLWFILRPAHDPECSPCRTKKNPLSSPCSECGYKPSYAHLDSTDWTQQKDYHENRRFTGPLFATERSTAVGNINTRIKIAIIDYDDFSKSGSTIEGIVFENFTGGALAVNLPYLLALPPASSSSPSSSAAAPAPVKDSPLPTSARASSSSSRYHVAPVGVQAAANAVAPAPAPAQTAPAKRPLPQVRPAWGGAELIITEAEAAQSACCIVS